MKSEEQEEREEMAKGTRWVLGVIRVIIIYVE